MTTQPSTKRVTAADVARSLGLSRATVGFVLNDTVGQTIPEATRERVKAEAARLGYRPHNAARALASGHSNIVLLVVPDWPYGHSLRAHLDEASLALDQAGYSLVTMTPHPGGQARPLWETLNPDVVMSMAPLPPELVKQLRRAGVPHVITAEPTTRTADDPGYTAGPRLQVEHLLERGRSRLAFAGSADGRLAGLVEERRSFAEQTHLRLTGTPLVAAADVDASSVATAVDAWLAAGVDGVIAYNDEVAALVAGAALRAGVGVGGGGRLAVIGHDDSPLAELFVPSLTSVHVDITGLGRGLAALALSAVNDTPPPAITSDTEVHIVQREST